MSFRSRSCGRGISLCLQVVESRVRTVSAPQTSTLDFSTCQTCALHAHPNPPIRWRDRRVDPIWGESTGNLGRSNIPSLCFGGGGCDSCTRQDPAEVFRTRRGDTPTWGFQKVACKSADNCAILAQAGSGRQRQQLQTLPVGSSPLGQGRQPQDQLAGVMHQPSRRVEDQEAQALGARGH